MACSIAANAWNWGSSSDTQLTLTQALNWLSTLTNWKCATKNQIVKQESKQQQQHHWFAPTLDNPTMASFATCGTEYRTAPALDPLDLVLPFRTQIAHTAASRTLCLPASSGVSLQLSQLEKCAQEDQCALI